MGEFFTSLAQGVAKLDHDLRSFVSEHDKGTLGRVARTKWFDNTPMDERSEGTTNAIDTKTGGAMGRRDFLKIAGTAAGAAILGETAKLLSACTTAPEASPTVPPSPTATPGFIEQGIQYNDVSVLDEAATLAEAKKAGIPLEDSYAAFINILQDKKQYPQLETNGATYDRFSIVVPNVSGMKTERFSYNFLGMRTKDGSHSYAFMFVPWLADDGKAVRGFKVVSLDPTELDVRGIRRGALAVFKDPMTEQAIEPKPVFIFPTNIADWRKMSPEQRAAETVQFLPYNLQPTKDIKISGGKLAKMVIMNPVILTPTPEPKATAEPTKAVEAAPATCLDLKAEQKVVDAYLAKKNFRNLIEAMDAQDGKIGKSKLSFTVSGKEPYASITSIENPLILGHYAFQNEKGRGNCVVVGYPYSARGITEIRVVSLMLDVTVGQEWSKFYTQEGNTYTPFDTEGKLLQWVDGLVANSQRGIGVSIRNVISKGISLDNVFLPGIFGRLMKFMFGDNFYALRYQDLTKWPKGMDPKQPDPSELADALRETKEVSLLINGLDINNTK